MNGPIKDNKNHRSGSKAKKPHKAIEAFTSTGKANIPSDVQGSYTGRDIDGPYAQPVQDADNL